MKSISRTALITGASRGIGEAAARHLATAGWTVVLTARSTSDIDRIAGEILSDGGKAIARTLDVADHNAVAATIDQTVDAHGSLDLYVNNAGQMNPIARIADSDPEAWGNMVDVNLKGVYHGLRYAIPAMINTGGGTIVNISSGAANSFLEGWSHYCATKAGVLRLTGVAHKEYGAQGVRVVGLSPGTVATQMQREIAASRINPVSQIPWERHISADWVAKAIEYLTTPDADPWLGTDFSLKTEEGRAAIGMNVDA
ncbi:SDR family oxidoreductase [Roseovarius sp. CAU 1744]|uniref:SDR family oxidoreductase n=1 Tax=Roseovarius sp. CAU 1744 TaxID=3140368 RepID=UPI00325BD0CA